MQSQKLAGLLFYAERERAGVAARLGAFAAKSTGWFDSVVSKPGVMTQLAIDGGLVAFRQLGNKRDVVLGCHAAENLLHFNLTGVSAI